MRPSRGGSFPSRTSRRWRSSPESRSRGWRGSAGNTLPARGADTRRTRAGSGRAAGRGWPRRYRAWAPRPRAPAPCRPAPCRGVPGWPRATGGRRSGTGRSRCCSCSWRGSPARRSRWPHPGCRTSARCWWCRIRSGLAPQVAGVAEPVGLVVVVVAGGEALHAALDGRIRDAVPVLDAGGAELDVVPGVGLFDAGVVGDTQSHFVRLVLHGGHDIAVDAENLDAVDALLFQRLHAGAGFGGIARTAEHGIDEDARRGEFPLGALPADFERAFGIAAHVADG